MSTRGQCRGVPRPVMRAHLLSMGVKYRSDRGCVRRKCSSCSCHRDPDNSTDRKVLVKLHPSAEKRFLMRNAELIYEPSAVHDAHFHISLDLPQVPVRGHEPKIEHFELRG